MSVHHIEDHRISKIAKKMALSFINDPADSEFLKGYLAALLDLHDEEYGCDHDARIALLWGQIKP